MNRALRACTSIAGVGLALTLGACASNQFGAPCPIPDKATPEQREEAIKSCFGIIGSDNFPANARRDLDILFLIDNSTSMSPKQRVLARNIPKFIQKIDSFGVNYHVGVVNSDVGSTATEGAFWSPVGGIRQCNTFKGPDGDGDGLLQVKPCTQRTNGSAEAQNACASLCTNPKFTGLSSVTTDGSRYISKKDGITNVPVDLVPDPNNPGKMIDMGPIEAFQCMALVGDDGCGIEGQLEGVKRALDGRRPENAGFLRKGSVLGIIFITDEDDCSVQLGRRAENNPITRACTNPDQNASWDCFNFDYRCLAASIQCDQPMNSDGAKTNCRERPNNYLETVKNYSNFLQSLVQKPEDVLIGGIWTLSPLDKGGQVNISYQNGTTSEFLNRGGGNLASCRYTGSDPAFSGVFGQAQRRLSDFAAGFGVDSKGMPNAIERSICDIDNYETALNAIADALKIRVLTNCLPIVPKVVNSKPVCLVGDVDESNPDAFPDTLFPTCSASCCQAFAGAPPETGVEDPTVKAACAAESQDCYCAVKSAQPNVCTAPGQVGWIGNVWRKGGVSAPSGRRLSFRCAGN